MSFRAMVLKRLNAVFVFTLLGASAALAQVPNAPIVFVKEQAITTTFLPAPAVGPGESGGGSEKQDWLKVEFHYGVIPPNPQKNPYVDSAEFKVWIEARDLYAEGAPKEGFAVLLTGSVTYVNLAQTRDAYGVFYVQPSTLARYGGQESFDRKFNIHLEASVGGAPVDVYDKNKDKDGAEWYKKIPTTIAGLVYRKDQCPFLMSDVTRYPAIKLPTTSGQ